MINKSFYLLGWMFWRRGKLSLEEPDKPLLRGRIHFIGFFVFLLLGLLLLFVSQNETSRLCHSIYLLSMLILFSTSTIFHTTEWKNAAIESLLQKLDHASIFLLITGTYTPVCVLLFDLTKKWPIYILACAWLIGIAGILKSLLIENPPKILNVLFYFVCGLTILPVLPEVFSSIGAILSLFMALGGFFYLLGGTIYGIEWPNPFPKFFGYHEIFHLLTLLANFCFLVPIIIFTIKNQ
jgi:hemolysin III